MEEGASLSRVALRVQGFAKGLGMACAIAVLAACSEPFAWPVGVTADTQPVQLSHPNVVLIVADDLGWKDVGFHGSEIETPVLDRLAAEGVTLSNFHTAPACTMTRAALMTGRSAIHSGLWYSVLSDHSHHGLPDEEYTIAERFRDAGYSTALVGKWHLGHTQPWHHPNAQGFDDFFGCMVCSRNYRTHKDADGLAHDLQENGVQVMDAQGVYLTDLLTSEAIRLINRRDRGRPLFLVVAYQAPHFPIQPPAFLRKKYERLGLSSQRAAYAGVVEALDSGIGRILNNLEVTGLDDDTIVVVMSDNGGAVPVGSDNSPLRGTKTRTFEGGIRVPVIVRYPGELEPGRVSDQLARERDLFATLERGAGLALRAPAESFNFWPQLQGAPSRNDRDFFFVFNFRADSSFRGVLKANRWKLVSEDFRKDFDESSPLLHETHLFDLQSDPGEQHDLADQQPERVAELEDLFEDYAALHPPGGLRGWQPQPPGWSSPPDLTIFLRRPCGAEGHVLGEGVDTNRPWCYPEAGP